MIAIVLACVLGLCSIAGANPQGAPLASCGAIVPDPSPSGHQVQSKPVANSPFILNISGLVNGYTAGRIYNLTLTGGATSYEGLLIQARLVSDSITAVGTFTNLASTTKIGPCSPTGSSITHTNNNLKNNLLFRWTAPPQGTGDIFFQYAVVIAVDNYYAPLLTAVVPELIGGTTGAPKTTTGATTANANSQGAGLSTTTTVGATSNGIWNPWTVSAVSAVAVLGTIVGIVFLAINFVSLAFYLNKLF